MQNILKPTTFLTQLKTMFGELDSKQKVERKLLRLK